jgi:hypothetical protein
MNIATLLGLKEPKRGDVGMELEVEAKHRLPAIQEKKWRAKDEQSLRGFGMEYYSSEPVKANETLGPRIKYLVDKLLDPNVLADPDSPRTSFHVHNNVTHLTPTQVWTAACAWWLLEPALVKYCDAGKRTREGGLFCLRLSDAEGVVPFIKQDLKNPSRPFRHLNDDRIRYMALNLTAVMRFGSLETRTMRGTLDFTVLTNWVMANHELISGAVREFSSPTALMDSHYRNGPHWLLRTLIPTYANLFRDQPGWVEEAQEQAGIVSEIAYFHDWDKWQARVAEKAKSEEKPEVKLDPGQLRFANIVNVVPPPQQEHWRILGPDNLVVLDEVIRLRNAGENVRYNILRNNWEVAVNE